MDWTNILGWVIILALLNRPTIFRIWKMLIERRSWCCGHIAADHFPEDSEIGTFKKGGCMRVGCECRGLKTNGA